MEPSRFDEVEFLRAVEASKARALLIGRRALVLLGLPVLTADYDFWLAIDDIVLFNNVAAGFELHPTVPAETARGRGRYVLENDEHIGVLVARSLSTLDGQPIEFDNVWARREAARVDGATVWIPSLDDLILLKQVVPRAQGPRGHPVIAYSQGAALMNERIARARERQVTREELQAELLRPIGDDEREEVLALVRWFTRRYPSGEARLAYVRQAYRRWRRQR